MNTPQADKYGDLQSPGWYAAFQEAVTLLKAQGLVVSSDEDGFVVLTRDGRDMGAELDSGQVMILRTIQTTIDSGTKASLPQYNVEADVLARTSDPGLATATYNTHRAMRSAGLEGFDAECIAQLLARDDSTVDMLDDWEARLQVDVGPLRDALGIQARPTHH